MNWKFWRKPKIELPAVEIWYEWQRVSGMDAYNLYVFKDEWGGEPRTIFRSTYLTSNGGWASRNLGEAVPPVMTLNGLVWHSLRKAKPMPDIDKDLAGFIACNFRKATDALEAKPYRVCV